MVEFKLVLSNKEGKSFPRIIKDKEALALIKKKLGNKFSGNEIGLEGYELEIMGGSDKCGFPMRKGISQKRQRIIQGQGVGFSGQNRNKKDQGGLRRKKNVCGDIITLDIIQVNLKILKEGTEKLVAAETQEKPGFSGHRKSEGFSSEKEEKKETR